MVPRLPQGPHGQGLSRESAKDSRWGPGPGEHQSSLRLALAAAPSSGLLLAQSLPVHGAGATPPESERCPCHAPN